MKSERTTEFIERYMNNLPAEIPDSAKWNIRLALNIAVEFTEKDTERRICEKAHNIIKEMMEGVFQGNMPQNIADEFSQKLNEE